MKNMLALVVALVAVPALANAQANPDDTTTDGSTGVEAPAPGTESTADSTATAAPNNGTLPTVTSDDDPHPEVASPGTPAGGIVSQAGVGGKVGYGRAGVLELGGSAGFTLAKDLTLLNFSPTIGWFVADNFQLSARIGASYAKSGDASTTLMSALIEPSYHLPFNRTTFAFIGLGFGAAYIEGPGAGFAMAPRVGANLMIGRSGVLSPSISYEYTTHDSIATADGALLAVSSAARLNIGYTLMW